MKQLILILAFALTLISCTKESTSYDPSTRADLSIEFDHIAGGADLQLQTGSYQNALGQRFTVDKLKYYVSNFRLTRTDGTVYVVPPDECYFLVDESLPASQRPLLKLPEGEYRQLSFLLGVDSLRNTMDVALRTGVLDVSAAASDMYWAWNSGYIFFKLEGNSPVAPMGGRLQFHVGGFGGYSVATINNLRTVTLDLDARGKASVRAGRRPNIHLMVDILKAFGGRANLDFSATSMVHSAAAGTVIANNYSAMFTHDHTEN